MNTLHPYMGWAGGDPVEGAVLAFARTARQARPLIFDTLRGWCTSIAYIDVRVARLREHGDYVVGLANPEKYAAGEAHCVDDPHSCTSCETWGIPLLDSGICVVCEHGGDA